MNDTFLEITEEALQAMLSHFERELPREGCGFLAGRDRTAYRFYPIHNINIDRRRFLMEPLHVQRTETSIYRREQRILGVCHSHPDGDCYPSKWDIAGAFFDAQYEMPLWTREVHVIALMDPVERPMVKAFRIGVGGRIDEVPLRIVAEPVGKISTCP